ncbi:TlpA family protein disulfide reductase [Lutibacter citreus]|uniref:TlpA family protein disulfide reductase n=1 Tax=Lutibacter citreus TaxID=2138210 RepID=UPI000DBE7256|nr:TlpA disulfide reductase family protein [Lutibacter citreus]
MHNKTISLLGFLITILLFSGCNSNNENSFIISGKIPTLKNRYILLSKIETIKMNKTTFIDSIKVDERGEFNSVYFLEPAIYSLSFNNERTILIAANRGQNIKFKGISVDKIKVAGSKDSKLLYAYQAFRTKSLNRLVKSVRDEIKNLDSTKISVKKITELRELEVENYGKHMNELADFVKDKMGNSIAIYVSALRWNNEKLPFFEDLMVDFSEKYPDLEITHQLQDKIELLKKTSIGSKISAIKMPNEFNKTISLDSIKGTYTLIDFWASWCPPCRTESVLLKELYKAYNPEGFQILSISLDSNGNRWLNALKLEQRTWPNVSTVEGFSTPVAIEYGITSLPYNILIDAEGKIVASNVHGKHLKEFVEKLFE